MQARQAAQRHALQHMPQEVHALEHTAAAGSEAASDAHGPAAWQRAGCWSAGQALTRQQLAAPACPRHPQQEEAWRAAVVGGAAAVSGSCPLKMPQQYRTLQGRRTVPAAAVQHSLTLLPEPTSTAVHPLTGPGAAVRVARHVLAGQVPHQLGAQQVVDDAGGDQQVRAKRGVAVPREDG